MTSYEQRVGLSKALYLRDQFGIEGRFGQPLQNGLEDDETVNQNGYFFGLYQAKSVQILQFLRELESKYPLSPPLLLPLEMFSGKKQLDHLQEFYSKSFNQMTPEEKDKLLKLYNTYLSLKEILQVGLNCKNNHPFSNSTTQCFIPIAPFLTADGFYSFKPQKEAPPVDQWTAYLESTLNDGKIKASNPIPSEALSSMPSDRYGGRSPLQTYTDFRHKVLQKKSVEELLSIGLKKALTKRDIDINYHTLVLVLHPDKLEKSPACKEEASELFKTLCEAKLALEKQI